METEAQATSVDALRDLLFAGAGFRGAVAEHFGVGVRETEAVEHLDARNGMTADELAWALRLTPGSVSDLIDRLEDAGLAQFAPGQGDQLRDTVCPTDRGRNLATEIRGWLALCLDLVADRSQATRTFAVVGHGLRSLGDELRDGRAETPRADAPLGSPIGVDRGDAEALQAALSRAALVLRLSHALARERQEATIAATVSAALRGHFDATFAGIALVDSGAATLRYVSLDPLPDDTRRRFASFPVDLAFPVCAAAVQGRAYFHPSVAAAEAEFPGVGVHMATAGLAAVVNLPLLAGADVIGALTLAWDRPHDVDVDDQGLLTVVAGYAAQALRRL